MITKLLKDTSCSSCTVRLRALYSGCPTLYNNLSNDDRQILRVALQGNFVGFGCNSKDDLEFVYLLMPMY